tara:strand:+ start:113 stop:499 length:387 start_codon:yes stop_codon:yes gene_type:complete
MSIIQPTKKPLYYTVVYVTPPNQTDKKSKKKKESDSNFLDTASIAIAMATNELGYTGFETEKSADGRVARVCYWDSYTSMSHWIRKVEKFASYSKTELTSLMCTTGCLWPWLMEKRNFSLEKISQKAA